MQMADTARPRPVKRLHPGPIRVMHWINAIMILIMIGSGFKIYENQPIFSWIRFPSFLLIGGDPEVAFKYNSDPGFGGALQWHFMAMWFVVINGLAYLTYGFATGRLRRKMLPIKPREVLETIREALHFRLSHDDITVYNAVQKLLYIGIILVVIAQVMSGLAIWKPVQFSHADASVPQFRDGAGRAFPGHERDLPVSRRACHACARGAAYPFGDDHWRSARE